MDKSDITKERRASYQLIRVHSESQLPGRPGGSKSENAIHPLSVKKAATFPPNAQQEYELLNASNEQIQKNPFLKARMKAYLQGLEAKPSLQGLEENDKSMASIETPDYQAPLFSEEKVTFKKINSRRVSTNTLNAEELKKKLLLKKEAESTE